MIVVAYTRFSDRLTEERFQDYLRMMPEDIRVKILRFRRWKDAHASLFGKLLLLRIIEQLQLTGFSLSQLQYNEYGRPSLEGFGDFNITHTDGFVACAFSREGAVGIDVERIRPIKLSDFTNIYTSEEWSSVHQAEDSNWQFFYLWTRKEALIKADGRGMSLNLTDIETLEDQVNIQGNSYFLQGLSLDTDYQFHLATDLSAPKLMIEEYSFL